MSKILNVKRGADPEFFLHEIGTNQPITSIGLIGGSKNKPRNIGNGYAWQEDNVAVEYNIPPANCKEAFVSSIHYMLELLEQELKPKGIGLSIVPTMEFSEEQLKHPQAQELGCEPDWNAWTQEQNPRPIAPANFRSSGGHLHISWDDPFPNDKIKMIKVHDLFCGVASLVHDEDVRRREIYGKAGAYRDKNYGVEYRTLSNFWIKSEELTAWLYNQSEKAIKFLNDGLRIDSDDALKIINCINDTNYNLMNELNEKYAIL